MGNELWHLISAKGSDIERETAQPPNFIDDIIVLFPVGWQPPPENFFKVNVDGAHNNQYGLSACGGINRDSNGSARVFSAT